jgi:hypothetical protein
VDLMSNLEKNISESQCGKTIMQDLHSSDEVLSKIQKLSITPQDHIGKKQLSSKLGFYVSTC